MSKKISKKQLSSMLACAENAAKEAGRILLRYRSKLTPAEINSKKALGLVTKADVLSEKKIKSLLLKEFPSSLFLGEEESFLASQKPWDLEEKYASNEFTWVVDPLDGTTNFVHGLDLFCICIGLLHFGEVVLGVVYRPVTGDLYYAFKDGGSYKKNIILKSRSKKLCIDSDVKKLKNSLLVTGFASEKGEVRKREFELFFKMMSSCRGVRRLGSAALDLCFLSEGVFGGFWERDLAPWDITAACIICEEAGLFIGDYSGQTFSAFQRTTLVCQNGLKAQMLKQLQAYR